MPPFQLLGFATTGQQPGDLGLAVPTAVGALVASLPTLIPVQLWQPTLRPSERQVRGGSAWQLGAPPRGLVPTSPDINLWTPYWLPGLPA